MCYRRAAGAGPLDRNHERFEDLRHNVFRCDEIDIVAANVLEVEHDARKLRRSDLRAVAKLAGLEVLTEHTAQIATAEKDRARSVPTTEAILFAEMRKRAGHAGEPSALAHADLVVEPVDLAVAWTNPARPQRFHRLLRALLENSFLERFDISRQERLTRQNKSPVAGQLDRRSAVTMSLPVAIEHPHCHKITLDRTALPHFWRQRDRCRARHNPTASARAPTPAREARALPRIPNDVAR
jgi:hypothetical protein